MKARMRVGVASAFAMAVCTATSVAASAEPPAEPPLPPLNEARPPLPPVPPGEPVPWARHLEIGAAIAFAEPLAHADAAGKTTPVRLLPGAGFSATLTWQVWRFLWFTGYLLETGHPLDFPAGSLGVSGQLSSDSAHIYTFGARATPTLPLGERGRLWLTAGAGWGRVAYPRLTVLEPGHDTFTIRDRAASVLEIPLGAGGSYEVVKNWLVVRLEVTGALLPSQTGNAMESGQTIDWAGKIRHVGSMPRLDATIVQTLGLALIL